MINVFLIGSGGEKIASKDDYGNLVPEWDDHSHMALNLEKVVFFHCVGDGQTAFETIDKRYVAMDVPFTDVCEALRGVTLINANR